MDEQPQQPNQQQKRMVAHKCCVSQVLSAPFTKEEGWVPSYLEIAGGKVSRVNIIATLVNKEEEEQRQKMSIDDGTGSIDITSFDKIGIFDSLKIGDLINIIGKPRVFSDQKYLIPEIITILDDKKWIKLRQLELKDVVIEKPEPTPVVEEKIKTESEAVPVEKKLPTNKIKETSFGSVLEDIRKMDSGDGVSYDDICSKCDVDEVDEVIRTLLERGEIFEIKPGKYKVLE